MFVTVWFWVATFFRLLNGEAYLISSLIQNESVLVLKSAASRSPLILPFLGAAFSRRRETLARLPMDNPDDSKRNKRKRGRKPKAWHKRSSPSPPASSDPVPVIGGRRGRNSRRNESPDHTDASLPVSPPCRGELNHLANGGDAMAVMEAGIASWEEVVRVVPCMDAVVKVFCVHTEPNFSLPWQRKRQYSSSSSGFIISGRRVLTNAHSVEHYTQVKLKKRGSDTKYLATVLAIGTECDIGVYAFSFHENACNVFSLKL